MNPVGDVKSEEQLNEKLLGAKKDLVVIHFWAPWAEQCTQMNNAMEELAKQYVRVHFLKVEAEELPEVSQKFEIAAVPTFIFLKNRTKIDRLDGAHVPELEKLVQRNVDAVAPSNVEDDSKASLAKKLKSLINASACVLFMKGTADAPRCGFSRQTVEILRKHNCDFTTFDILEAPDVRQGLKEYSNWPTYPQLYINGKLLGGLDIIKEMDEDGELDEQLPKVVKKAPLEERLKDLISKENVMVFMKGDPDGPRCGFSKKIVEILKQTGAKFGHFDILSDEEVRQGLKTFSNWPTYPQLYINGELIGGLDIVKEMHEEGELADSLQ